MSWLDHVPNSKSLEHFHEILQNLLNLHKYYLMRHNSPTFSLISASLLQLESVIYGPVAPKQETLNSIIALFNLELGNLKEKGPNHENHSRQFAEYYSAVTKHVGELTTTLAADLTAHATIMAEKSSKNHIAVVTTTPPAESKQGEEKQADAKAAAEPRKKMPLTRRQARSYIRALAVEGSLWSDIVPYWAGDAFTRRGLSLAYDQHPVPAWFSSAVPVAAFTSFVAPIFNSWFPNDRSSSSAQDSLPAQVALLTTEAALFLYLAVRTRSKNWFFPTPKPQVAKEAKTDAKAAASKGTDVYVPLADGPNTAPTRKNGC